MALKQKIENGLVYQFNPFAGTWKKIGKAPERYSKKEFEGKVFEGVGKDLPINVSPERKIVGQVYLPEMSTIADSVGSAVGGAIMKGGKVVSDAIINAGQRATAPAFRAGEQAASNVNTSVTPDKPSPYGEITTPKSGVNYYARAFAANAYKAGQDLVNGDVAPQPLPNSPQPMPQVDSSPSLGEMKNKMQTRANDTSRVLYEGRLANDNANYLKSKFQQEQAELEAMHQKNVASELEYNRQKNAFPWESKSSGIVVDKPQPPMSTKDFKGLSLDKQIARAGIPLTPAQNAAAEASGRAKIEAEFPTSATPTAPAMTQDKISSQPASRTKYDYAEFERRKAMAQSGKGRIVNEDDIDQPIM